MNKRRIVVTGIGAVTPIGSTAEGLWRGVQGGKSAIRPVTRFDVSGFRSRVAAEINDFDPFDYMERHVARKLDRFAQLGVAAASQALKNSGLNLIAEDPRRVGVSLGSALGGVAYGEEQHRLFLEGGIQSISPRLATAIYGGASGGNIAIHLNLRGPDLTNANSCASGSVAIGEALRVLQRGEADVMLAGGVEAPLAPLTFAAFGLIKAMSTRNEDPETSSRPFDSGRDGFVMGEGGALMVLEERSAAVSRGAHIYAEVIGYAHTNDAYHMTAPRPDGSEAARAVTNALRDARTSSEYVDYVNAHASATPLGDAAEWCALEQALGAHTRNVPVSGTKGLYGHPLGASGAIEACITALALKHGFLPGTTNLEKRDQGCPLNLLPPEGMSQEAQVAVSTSFGFGGSNAALVFGRHQA